MAGRMAPRKIAVFVHYCVDTEQTHAQTTDPETSHAEAKRVKFTDDCQRVVADLKRFAKRRKPPYEFTASEIRARWIAACNGTSRADSRRRRISDLLKLGVLQDTGKRRNGSRVLTLTPPTEQSA
jgi:hypothetical protein